MPLNGWSVNWESMATRKRERERERERENLETRCVERFLVVYMCVVALHDRCQKTAPVPIRG